MPWKEGYTISDEATLPDDAVHWPQSFVCCVRVVVDLGLATAPGGLVPADFSNADAVYSMGQGLDVVLDLLDRYGIRATFAVPAMMAAAYPERIRAIQSHRHEIAANGLKQEDVSLLSPGEERRRLAFATELIGDVTGARPVGWFGLPRVGDRYATGTVSAATVDLLIDAGYQYLGTGLADDIPHYWVADFERRGTLLTLPSYYHFNDQYFLLYPRKGSGLERPDVLLRNWRWEFDAQYARGRHFEMTIHPQHIAWSDRLPGVESFLQHMRAHSGVWFPTSSECASWWLDRYPAAAVLDLRPTVWKDHQGSMS